MMKLQYTVNPWPKREAMKMSYTLTPLPKKRAERVRCTSNPQPKKEAERARYIANPKPKIKAVRVRYLVHPEPARQAFQRWYNKKHSAALHKRRCQYYSSLKSKRAAKLLKYAACHSSRRAKNKSLYQ